MIGVSRTVTAAVAAAALAELACGDRAPRASATGPLPSGIAARVGSEDISVANVERIAAAQGLTPREARERAITDTLFALAFRADPARQARVSSSERTVLARALLQRIQAQANAEGPPTDAEIEKLTEERWTELDRPRAVRTTHAVVIVKKPEDRPAARALATRLADLVRDAANAQDFANRARTVSTPELEVKAEHLSPVAADTRTFEPPSVPGMPFESTGKLDPTFTRAAHALSEVGQQSPVVETPFGFHVILLDAVVPEARSTLEERRRLLEPEIRSRRAKRLLEDLRTRLKASTAVEEPRDVETLTALVPVEP